MAPLLLIRLLRMTSAFKSFPEKKQTDATRSAEHTLYKQSTLTRHGRATAAGKRSVSTSDTNTAIACGRGRTVGSQESGGGAAPV